MLVGLDVKIETLAVPRDIGRYPRASREISPVSTGIDKTFETILLASLCHRTISDLLDEYSLLGDIPEKVHSQCVGSTPFAIFDWTFANVGRILRVEYLIPSKYD
jgi:hypothetical protein